LAMVEGSPIAAASMSVSLHWSKLHFASTNSSNRVSSWCLHGKIRGYTYYVRCRAILVLEILWLDNNSRTTSFPGSNSVQYHAVPWGTTTTGSSIVDNVAYLHICAII
jgi:hypothetical protein